MNYLDPNWDFLYTRNLSLYDVFLFSFVSCVIACYGKQRTFSVCKVENALWSEVITIMCGNVSCILNIKPCFCVSHNCHFLNRDYLKLLTPSTSQEERY